MLFVLLSGVCKSRVDYVGVWLSETLLHWLILKVSIQSKNAVYILYFIIQCYSSKYWTTGQFPWTLIISYRNSILSENPRKKTSSTGYCAWLTYDLYNSPFSVDFFFFFFNPKHSCGIFWLHSLKIITLRFTGAWQGVIHVHLLSIISSCFTAGSKSFKMMTRFPQYSSVFSIGTKQKKRVLYFFSFTRV